MRDLTWSFEEEDKMATEDMRLPMAGLRENHNVVVQKVENGFVVSIGCKIFVAKEWAEVSEGLELYFRNPEEAQKKYCKS